MTTSNALDVPDKSEPVVPQIVRRRVAPRTVVRSAGIAHLVGAVGLSVWAAASLMIIMVTSVMPLHQPLRPSTEAGSGVRWGTNDPPTVRACVVNVATGAPIYVALAVVGVGLLLRKEWARRWSVRLAMIALVRCWILYPYMVLVVTPHVAEQRFRAQLIDYEAFFSPEFVRRIAVESAVSYGAVQTLLGAGVLAAVTLYAVATLWQLRRDDVRDDCADPLLAEVVDP